MKRAVEVKILGQTFTVASDERDDHLRKVAEMVDAKMRELAGGPRAVTTANVAILAALNIASEYQKLMDEREALHHALDKLAWRVQEWLKD